MDPELNPYADINLSDLRSSLAAWKVWESVLVDAAKLGSTAQKLGFGHFRDDDILVLWRIGILRADVVTGEAPASVEGLLKVEVPEGMRYIDMRLPARRGEGAPSAVPDTGSQDGQLKLTPYFHPYRVYVLHHVVRTLRISTSNTQFLTWTPGVATVVDWQLKELYRWTNSDGFIERFDHWNRISELAAVCEAIRWMNPEPDDGDPDQVWLRTYAPRVRQTLETFGLGVDSIRRDLAFAANDCDSNSRIHTLLRLMTPFERERIEGRLGAAMKFLDMAESIRRAAERLLGKQLPEEDELGLGTWMDGAREAIYGAKRVYDAAPGQLRDFLGGLGLIVGVKVRCYVEGETELGALRHAVGTSGLCMFINLKGKVLERGSKALAFADSLANDKSSHIFSIIAIDADRQDEARMLRVSAERELFHGAFALFDPDLEFANFSVDELLTVALGMAARMREKSSPPTPAHADVLSHVQSARSADEFFKNFHQATDLREVDKGEDWGAALMAYAIDHRTLPAGHTRSVQTRPLLEIAEILVRAQRASFLQSLAGEKVDSTTGKIVARYSDSALLPERA